MLLVSDVVIEGLAQSKITDFGYETPLQSTDQNVSRCQITMHDTFSTKVFHALGNVIGPFEEHPLVKVVDGDLVFQAGLDLFSVIN